ncbi:C40 family peptidase [Streptomyces thermoalcalitolerans]|uniref:C40 family peptidase n=1 Tax=Streptomyces thermoalcalitolerans TaxID=65605 RepID=A0ABN1PDB7_9ACTN
MASHRKAHPAATRATGTRTPAPAADALAAAAPAFRSPGAVLAGNGGRPSPEEIEKKLDYLYRRTGPASRQQASREKQEKGARQRGRVAALLDDVARRTDVFTKARQKLGAFAAAPHRTHDTAAETAALLLAEAPQGYFDQAQVLSRLNARRKSLSDAPAARPAARPVVPSQPPEALRAPEPEPPAEPEYDIAAAKTATQKKLAHARVLLSAAAALKAASEPSAPSGPASSGPAPSEAVPAGSTPSGPAPTGTVPPGPVPAGAMPSGSVPSGTAPAGPASSAPASDSVGASKAEKALAFARAQIGKPYVWGASGPESYDCSGLTQAAWKAAGVTLPRSTLDQAHAGTTVPLTAARPGDLVFFASPSGDVDHVGVYAGDGMVIHAPRPGSYVCQEPIPHDGESSVHHVVRPA